MDTPEYQRMLDVLLVFLWTPGRPTSKSFMLKYLRKYYEI